MAYDILQSSTQSVLLFFMTDSTDHITGKTGLTPTVTISKNGAAFGSPSGAVSEISSGWYKVAGNATDTGTLGPLALHATATGADACDIIVANIVAYNPQDSVRIGMTALPNAAAAAAGGLWILGANAAATTTLTGVAASGATPATPALSLTGGAASTTGGGVAAQGLLATGGAGAGSTNGASEGVKFIGGGTNTVASAAHGLNLTGTSTGSGLNAGSGSGATGNGITATANSTNGSGATLTKSGSGSDLNATSTSLTLAKTTNITGFNDIAATAVVSAGAITTSSGAVSTVTSVTNRVTANTDQLAGQTVTAAAGVTFPSSVASPTNITAGTITTATNVTNGVTVSTNNDKTGYSLTADFRIKKNTALSAFPVVMIDAADHISPKTGLTVSASRSIDGGAFAACANAVAEVGNGVYKIDLATTDLNADTVTLLFTATGADNRLISFVTQTE